MGDLWGVSSIKKILFVGFSSVKKAISKSIIEIGPGLFLILLIEIIFFTFMSEYFFSWQS